MHDITAAKQQTIGGIAILEMARAQRGNALSAPLIEAMLREILAIFADCDVLATNAEKTRIRRSFLRRARHDSNVRPLAPEASALSTELRAREREA